MEVSVRLELESGPTLHLRPPPKPYNPQGPSIEFRISMINVHADEDSAELDKGIRRLWLGRQVHEREATTRVGRETSYALDPTKFDEAVDYFISLLRQGSDQTSPIYLADRYFMTPFSKDNKEQLEQLYLKMFGATTGRPLQILCTEKE